jgi:hypothetical protein
MNLVPNIEYYFKPAYSSVPRPAGKTFGKQAMTFAELRRHAKVFEKKLSQTRTKKGPVYGKPKEKKPSNGTPVSGGMYPFRSLVCCIKPDPAPGVFANSFSDVAGSEQNLSGKGLPVCPTACRDARFLSPLKSVVITFGFLSQLEAHVSCCANVIQIFWVAQTRETYFFLKKNMGRLSGFLNRRLKKKIITGLRLKKRAFNHF